MPLNMTIGQLNDELRECEGSGRMDNRGQMRSGYLRHEISSATDFSDKLNFEFARNKNLMAAFMNRLRRVYQVLYIRESMHFVIVAGALILKRWTMCAAKSQVSAPPSRWGFTDLRRQGTREIR